MTGHGEPHSLPLGLTRTSRARSAASASARSRSTPSPTNSTRPPPVRRCRRCWWRGSMPRRRHRSAVSAPPPGRHCTSSYVFRHPARFVVDGCQAAYDLDGDRFNRLRWRNRYLITPELGKRLLSNTEDGPARGLKCRGLLAVCTNLACVVVRPVVFDNHANARHRDVVGLFVASVRVIASRSFRGQGNRTELHPACKWSTGFAADGDSAAAQRRPCFDSWRPALMQLFDRQRRPP